MKQKVSDYIADYIANWGIRDVFTVTGGGAMHMNDAFGHHPKLHCTYQHHEQACAMAAEAYARMDNRMAAVCVTTGPGATNAITGVLGCWMDSIPMIVFSGQARYATTVAASGLKLRSMGVQECNIVPVVTSLTKYAQMVIDPKEIRYHLEKALYMAVNGRPGPVWLDIPLDVQGATIETEDLRGYDPKENPEETPAAISQDVVKAIVDCTESSSGTVSGKWCAACRRDRRFPQTCKYSGSSGDHRNEQCRCTGIPSPIFCRKEWRNRNTSGKFSTPEQ